MDKKAKNILFKTYWNTNGWIDNPITDSSDFEYAKTKGLMYEPLTISKSELLKELDKVLKIISLTKVTDAFLSSFSNNRLDWRSGFASYINAQRLLEKNATDYQLGFGKDEDINVLNFERIKWGGVRHWSGLYNLIDLKILEKENIPTPTEEDKNLFRAILAIIEKSDNKDAPSKLRDNLKVALNKSKDERHVLMEILGCVDILKPLKYDRKEPHTHDWDFVLHWRGEDKYDKEKVKLYFGSDFY